MLSYESMIKKCGLLLQYISSNAIISGNFAEMCMYIKQMSIETPCLGHSPTGPDGHLPQVWFITKLSAMSMNFHVLSTIML